MKQLPSELCTRIASLLDTQSAARLRRVNKYLNENARSAVFFSVELNHGIEQTFSFCETMLSKAGALCVPHFKHISIGPRTFFPLDEPFIEALRLLPRVIVVATSLRTIRLDWVTSAFLMSSAFSPNAFQDHRLKKAYIDTLSTMSSMSHSISHLSLESISPTLAVELQASVAFPSLTSFSGPIEVFAALSYHHPLQNINLRVHWGPHAYPSWIASKTEVAGFSSALGRVPAKSISFGIDATNDQHQLFCALDRILDAAPRLEALAVTMLADSSTFTPNDANTIFSQAVIQRLKGISRLWLHLSDNQRRTINWCPRTQIWFSGHRSIHSPNTARVPCTFQKVQKKWLELLSEPTTNTFLLRVDIHAQTSAIGWRRVDGVWVKSKDETDQATRGVMFGQAEVADHTIDETSHTCWMANSDS